MAKSQSVTQAILVSQSKLSKTQSIEQFALFDSAGVPITPYNPTKIVLTGYTSHAVGAISATDTLLIAIAKLEARIAVLEAA